MKADSFELLEGRTHIDISDDKTWLDTKGVREALDRKSVV